MRQKLLPGGLTSSPYEIFDYRAMVILDDPEGMRAKFHRTQSIRFLQDGVAGILDHAWGDGVPLTFYHNQAGPLEDWFNEHGKQHLIIGLKKAMARGETLTFSVSRTAMVGFQKGEEWLETTIDHPVKRMRCDIVFPKERPCQRATLSYQGTEIPLPVRSVGEGKTSIYFELSEPSPYVISVVRWIW